MREILPPQDLAFFGSMSDNPACSRQFAGFTFSVCSWLCVSAATVLREGSHLSESVQSVADEKEPSGGEQSISDYGKAKARK
jgi:hypothetical protein